jgi:hypothetical protein
MPIAARHPDRQQREQREQAQFMELLARRHAERDRLPLQLARRHVQQISVTSRKRIEIEASHCDVGE